MKRLLAYLFIVLGLTILFQTKLYAPMIILTGDYCVTKKASWIGHVVTKMKENSICDDIIVNPNKHHNFYFFLTGRDQGIGVFHVPKKIIQPFLKSHEKQTQIAKKEPSQTQEVATSGTIFCQKNNADIKKNLTTPVFRVKNSNCPSNSKKIKFEKYVDILVYWNSWKSPMSQTIALNVASSIKKEFIKENLDTSYLELAILRGFTSIAGGRDNLLAALNTSKQTQIAKAEPSQTQEVAGKIEKIDLIFCKQFEGQFYFEVFIKNIFEKCPSSYPIKVDYKEYLDKSKNARGNGRMVLCFENHSSTKNILETGRENWCEASYNWGYNKMKQTILEPLFDGKNIYLLKDKLPGDLDISKKTQIAKKEPSQTQEVVGKESNFTTITEGYARITKSKIKLGEEHFIFQDVCKLAKINARENILAQSENYQKGNIISEKIISKDTQKNNFSPSSQEKIFSCELEVQYVISTKQTQIAKKEPSQTQEVASVENIKNYISNVIYCQDWDDKTVTAFLSADATGYTGGCPRKELSYKLFKKSIKSKSFCYRYKGSPALSWNTNSCDTSNSNWASLKHDGKNLYYSLEQTQTTKIEPTIKPEDKPVEVAKTTQEEFKPEDKDIDNDPPVIEIAEAITFNDSDYEFEGQVTDKSKQIFIEVDGRLVDVKKGIFTVKGYSPVDKEISIEAIDGYGNRSKPKIVKIIIDIKDTDIVKLEPLNPSKIRTKTSKNKVALIIGIENYENTPAAKYASLDAKYFTEYAKNVFGVSKNNIKLLTDEEANLSKTNSAIFKWLPAKIKENKTDLIVFYSGHGLASSDGKEKYILPSNADPDLLFKTAISRTEFFDQIISLKPKSVTIFFDTCYSGVSRDEEMLLASAKPLRIVADDENKIPENFTIFTASKSDQISSGLKEAKHGIFSYYLMKGLEGKADSNKDYKITNGELIAYMDQNVSEKALDLGRQQNPMLSGDPDQILMSYR